MPTDRLVAEWWLDSPRVIAAIQDLAPKVSSAPAAIELPTELEQRTEQDSARVRAVQTRVREEFTKSFARGHAAIAVKAGEKSTAYLLAPWSDF
jgi:predicted GNAT superfamily acetyltransferase